jgi:putative serine protease PepD
MERDGARRRGVVVALLAATAVLAPAAAWAGYAAGQRLDAPAVTAATPAPSGTAVMTPTASPAPTLPPTALSQEARRLAERATVRLSPPSGYYVGSGSIVSPDGLVLTNAHVARPTAPGLAASYGEDLFPEADPERLVVSTTDGDGPAEPAYLADVLAVDGHLDLAVLRITALDDGQPLPAGLRFPSVEIGSVTSLELGDDLTVYGFPALNGGDLLTVRPGIVSSFLPDRSGRVRGERFEIETNADFSGGNSGGMALSNDGRLVGVPSARLTTEELVVAHYVRSVDLAVPLLTAARAGRTYRSPYLVAGTGNEQAEDLGWSAESSCTASGSASLVDPRYGGFGRFRLQGLAPDQDVLAVLRANGSVVRVSASAYDPEQECTTVSLPYDEQGRVALGDYELDVRVGPDRDRVLVSTVVVSAGD